MSPRRPLALGLACLAPAARPAPRLHRHGDDEAQAPLRPAGLAGRVAWWRSPSPRSISRKASATRDLWLVPVSGGEPRRITTNPASDSRPRWSPDGTRVAFLSTRDGGSQVWVLDLAGGEPRKLTSLATGADSFAWIDAKRLLVATRGLPGLRRTTTPATRRGSAEAGKPSSARAYDDLLYRHWDTWDDGRRQPPSRGAGPGRGRASISRPEATTCRRSASGGEDWSVSPDGQEACFSRKDRKDEAWSTNADVFVVPTAGGAPKRVGDAPGYDGGCRYSPDGEPPRLADAVASGLRVRPLAAGGARPPVGRPPESHRRTSTAPWSRSSSRRTRRRSTSRRRRRAVRPSSPCPPPEARCATVLDGGTFG